MRRVSGSLLIENWGCGCLCCGVQGDRVLVGRGGWWKVGREKFCIWARSDERMQERFVTLVGRNSTICSTVHYSSYRREGRPKSDI
jgi:hypothetical protein